MLPAADDPSTARLALLHAHLARLDRARTIGFSTTPFNADSPVPYLLLVAPVFRLIEHGLELKATDVQSVQRWLHLFRSNLRRAMFPTSSPPLIPRTAALYPDIDPLVLSTLNAASGLLARGVLDDVTRLGVKSRQAFEHALDCAGEAATDVLMRCSEVTSAHRLSVWQYVTVAAGAYQ